ncbi:hypothetical protein ACTFIR_003972 [Dictyostelium discoideum]
MGQKTNPIGFRLVIKQDFGDLLGENDRIRQHLMKKPCCSGASFIAIRRMSDKVEIVINTARPGLVIGKKGSEIDVLRNELAQLTGKEIWIEVEEIKRPDISRWNCMSIRTPYSIQKSK